MTTLPSQHPAQRRSKSHGTARARAAAWRCEHFRGDHAIDIKGHRNIVTETDVAAELRIIEILRAEYPDHAVLSEETAADTDAVARLDVGDRSDRRHEELRHRRPVLVHEHRALLRCGAGGRR